MMPDVPVFPLPELFPIHGAPSLDISPSSSLMSRTSAASDVDEVPLNGGGREAGSGGGGTSSSSVGEEWVSDGGDGGRKVLVGGVLTVGLVDGVLVDTSSEDDTAVGDVWNVDDSSCGILELNEHRDVDALFHRSRDRPTLKVKCSNYSLRLN